MALELEHVRKQIGEVAEARAGLMHKIDAKEEQLNAIEVKLSAEKGEQGKLLLLGMELALHQQLVELMKEKNVLQTQLAELMKKENVLAQKEGAVAGLGPQSAAGACGTLDVDDLATRVAAKLNVALGRRDPITVTASTCNSSTRKTIERALPEKFDFSGQCALPCCLHPQPEPYTPKEFIWQGSMEDAPENVVKAIDWLAENLAPQGVKVLPVQQHSWLDSTVDLSSSTSIYIKESKTDYLFVGTDTWTACQKERGARVEGHRLLVDKGSVPDAIMLMLPGIVGFYEAKTSDALKANLSAVRAQALLQYLAINQMQNWPKDGVVVVFGDFSKHYTVHAGRGGDKGFKPALHVTIPANQLSTVNEEASLSYTSGGADSVTTGFVRKLLGTCRTGTKPSRPPSGDSNSGAAGGGSSGSGGARAADGSSGSGGAGTAGNSSKSGGAATAGGSSEAAGSSGAGSGGRATGFEGNVAAPHGDDDEQQGALTCCSKASDTSSDAYSTDEGLLEGAKENANAQRFMSLLCLPDVYEGLGLSAPPTSFTPLSREQYLASFTSL